MKKIVLDEVNSDVEDGIDNLMNDSDIEFVLEESFKNELDSDDEPLNLFVPESNDHVVKNPTIEKTLEEGCKRKKQRKWQRKRKRQKKKQRKRN